MKMGRHGRYVKRTAAFLLSAVLAAGLLSGCGKGKTEEQNKENTSVKGRYVENDMELPIQEGEKILNMAKSKDGNPVLFSEAEDVTQPVVPCPVNLKIGHRRVSVIALLAKIRNGLLSTCLSMIPGQQRRAR